MHYLSTTFSDLGQIFSFDELADTLPHIVVLARPDGAVIYNNKYLYEYSGLGLSDTPSGCWEQMIHPDDLSLSRETWEHSLATGEPLEIEFRLRRHDGIYRWHLGRALARRGSHQAISLWVGSCTDIDDLKSAKEGFRRTSELLNGLAQGVPDAVFIKDLAGKYLFFNDAAARFVGKPVAEVLGHDDTTLFEPESARVVMTRDQRVISTGQVETEEECLTTGGVTRVFLATKAPYRDSAGKILGVIGISHDITDRKQTENELRLFRALIDQTTDAIEVIDTETGRFLDVNERACIVHGYTRDEHKSLTIADIDPWVAARNWSEHLVNLRASVGQSFESTHRRKDGLTFPVEVNVNFFTLEREYMVAVVRDITERKQAEQALRLRDRAMQAATQGIVITDPTRVDNPIVYASPGFERITGYRLDEVIGRNCRFLQGRDTDANSIAQLRQAVRKGQSCTVEMLNYRKDGTSYWNEVSISPVHDADGRVINYIGLQADITARKNMDDRLRQAQKMEAMGRLAGGIAHDFNNLLTIINGYSALLMKKILPGDPYYEMIEEIRQAGVRSAGLTDQLLAFSRKQILVPRSLNLNVVVADTQKMLRRLIGEDVRLVTSLDPDLWPIRADQGQLEQVLVNLAVNARDAIAGMGQLTIATRNVELDEVYVRAHPQARCGPYVLMSVSDTGCGISPDVMAMIFEPFFSTKGPGKGTGLGLATLYSIIKQCEGFVDVESEVGVGTTFKIYFPRVENLSAIKQSLNVETIPPRGTETVLLVEDEKGVRALTRDILSGLGYHVLEAASGEEALGIAARQKTIHLLVADVVMPGMGGRVVAEQVKIRHPAVRSLFVSGYTDDAVIRHGVFRDEVNFLQKPFTPLALAIKLREVLIPNGSDTAPTGQGTSLQIPSNNTSV